MTSITVTAERKYEVVFPDNWRDELNRVSGGRRRIIIAPRTIIDHPLFQASDDLVYEVPEGENQKSLKVYGEILSFLVRNHISRHDLIVGIGGGATTDLAGFVAATYMRGLDWIAIPTSVAGALDAAIGGKTGLNLDEGKNLVGSFYSPRRVIIDFNWLGSLPERDVKAGLVEAIKCGFISDPTILDLIVNYQSNLAEIIRRSVAVKAEVVSLDFTESSIREILNYGHTLGHAIEQHSKYSMRHGEAVARGLLFAAELSARLSGLDQKVVQLHRELLSSIDMDLSYPAEAWPELFTLMLRDKKRANENPRFVTLESIAKPARCDKAGQAELQDIYISTIARGRIHQ